MQNVGTLDRTLRVIVAIALVACAIAAPLSWPIRLFGFGATAAYVLFTSVAGTCLGYRMMGMSTCPTRPR